MIHNTNKLWYALFGLLALLFSSTSFADYEDITVMSLGVVEGRAVVRTEKGTMAILRVGDTLPRSTAIVKQILSDRLVVQNLTVSEPPRTETVWIFKAKAGKSRVQKLDPQAPEIPIKAFQTVHEAKKP